MRHFFRFISIVCLFALFSMPAHAAPKTYKYEVYGGGVHAVSATLKLDQGEKDYATSLTAVTRGLLGKLAPWQGVFASKGRFKDGTPLPAEHSSQDLWRGEGELKTYTYDKNGVFQSLKIVEDGKDKTKEQPEAALTRGTTDILSATLQVMMTAAATGKCEGTSDIFDGSRRFTLHFQSMGEELLEKSRYAPFEGTAMKCAVEITPKGGKWHEKPRGWMSIQEQGRAKGSLPTVWLAKAPGAAKDDPAVPVRIRVKTDYGTLFMHLVSAM